MLLLMMQTKFDDGRQCVGRIESAIHHQVHHVPIDFATVLPHLRHRRPGKQPTAFARKLLAHCVVVRIEKISVFTTVRLISRRFGQHKGFEKPGGMGQMPTDRAGIGHRLNAAIFRLQRFAQRFAQ